MFDLGMMELLVIGIVALIVVGPKDLPGMFRTIGNLVGKAKGMAREFQRSMDQAANESGLKDATSDLNEMTESVKSATKFDAKSFNADLGEPIKAPKPPEEPSEISAPKETAKKPVTKKPAAKAAAKKPAAKKVTTAKAATKKPAVKKTPAKKPTVKKATASKDNS